MQHPILMYGLSVYGLFAAAFIYLWYRLGQLCENHPSLRRRNRSRPPSSQVDTN